MPHRRAVLLLLQGHVLVFPEAIARREMRRPRLDNVFRDLVREGSVLADLAPLLSFTLRPIESEDPRRPRVLQHLGEENVIVLWFYPAGISIWRTHHLGARLPRLNLESPAASGCCDWLRLWLRGGGSGSEGGFTSGSGSEHGGRRLRLGLQLRRQLRFRLGGGSCSWQAHHARACLLACARTHEQSRGRPSCRSPLRRSGTLGSPGSHARIRFD